MPDITAEDLRRLYEEQGRLRAEVERLRDEQQKLQEQSKESEQKEGDKKEGEGKEQGKKEGGKEEDKDKDKKDEGKEENKDKPKEPATKRAAGWVRSHPIAFVLILVGLVVLVIGGYLVWQYVESFENTDDAQVDGHTNPISPRINGTVVGAYVENTYWVKKGQVLVDLDPRDYQVSLAQARANLAQAVASLNAQSPNLPITQTTQSTQVANAGLSVASAQAALTAAQQQYEAALADVAQAEANAANAQREQERYAQLIPKLEVSREQYDQRVTAAHAQEAQVAARKASADAARKQVDQRQAALDQAITSLEETKSNLPRQIAVQHATTATRQANVQAAKAQMDQAVLNLSYCKIVAPIDGIVGDKTVEVGQQLAPGQEMFAITDVNDIWVTANFKETQIRNMHAGQSVTIRVDALSQDFDGYIEALPGGTGATYSLLPPENATGNYVKVVQRLPVRIRFKKGQRYLDRLRPGMSVEPKVWVK